MSRPMAAQEKQRRYDERLESRYVPEPNSGCWLWCATTDAKGYGVSWHNGKKCLAHRHFYELHHGQAPGPLYVCHRCDNPSCVNPDHLFLGTQADNMRDMAVKCRGHKPGDPRLARGDGHGSRTKPEAKPRGITHPAAKLSEADVLRVR